MSFACLILAAGKSTRMHSTTPKVLHKIAGQPMLRYCINTAMMLKPDKMAIIVGEGMGEVSDYAAPIHTIIQSPAHGTGHAVQCGAPFLAGHNGPVLVIYGDTPFLHPGTLQKLIDQIRAGAAVAIAGFYPDDPAQYGRLVTDQKGGLEAIVEFADCTEAQKTIAFCNAGLMAIDGKQLPVLLSQLTPKNAQKELYLTDLVHLARAKGLPCKAIEAEVEEVMGINTRAQLAAAEDTMQKRLRQKFLTAGVGMIDPNSVYFCMDTQIGTDVTIEPNVFFGPNVKIENGVTIKAFSHIEGTHAKTGAIIGPFARLRPGAVLDENVKVGNFVEIKNAHLGAGASAGHLTYLGDADIGADTNIGAGTITCNYDGVNKHQTKIGSNAFIGSNTALVAPVSVGAGAIVGAGSVITENVDPGALAIGRAPQVNKPGWAKQFRDFLLGKKNKKSA
ncbi:MAG: bifunctional UDP-N-acetylglucosamine diphosphorylase/glucosamine-1-phosphate N-acetyltransferase GlmU [Alphaproteobacteria bacterium]|nr:MAG: bifunctional UDP-N-acetylglucosamine diphosphorylase/glucosamine-1-phosphate N-acetyltransferase GlmU [Alphaproteobacteria bacterium]